MFKYMLFILWSLITVVLIGCGGSSSSAVTGMVTVDDKPLPNALVRFIPIGSTNGRGGTGKTDAQGRYILVDSQGGKDLPQGEYTVVISRRLQPDGSEPDPNKPPIESNARESLPEVWSSETKSVLKVVIPSPTKTYNFPLKLKKE